MIATILGYFTVAALRGLLGTIWKGFCDFISTPIGAALIAGLVMYGIGDLHGHRVTNAAWQTKWDTAEVEAEKARLARDADIKAKVEADANQRLAPLVMRKAQLESKVKAYEDEQAKQVAVGNACAPELTDGGDARWLRDIQRRPQAKSTTRRGLADRLRELNR